MSEVYPPLRRIINLFEPDGPDRATEIEDGGDADFTWEFSVLDYGCHAEIMGEQPGGCKEDNLTYGPLSLGPSWVCFSCPDGQKADFLHRLSTAMVIIQSEVVAAKFIIHPCRQANYPVWLQLSPS